METSKRTLVDLACGIVFAGIVFQLTIVWLVEEKLAYSLGLWVGVGTAVFYAWHMWSVLNKALDLPAEAAQKMIRLKALLRYGIVVLIMFVCCEIPMLNPLATFLGIMTLKVAAYIQPFTHKVINKTRR